ncbi:MAG TPA: hypothetical protein VF670_16535, partial [Duganella sp.]
MTSTRAPRNTTAMLAFALLAAPAWAGRPLITEDAGDVLEAGRCEIESYVARFNDPALTFQWAQLGCGTGFNTQLAAGAGREKTHPGHVTIVAAGGKTTIRKLSEDRAGIALAYATLGGKHSDHLQHQASEIKAVLTVPYRQWLLHANAGWVRNHAADADRTIWALALERPRAFGPIDLMGEIVGDDRGSPFAQVAARWTAIPGR